MSSTHEPEQLKGFKTERREAAAARATPLYKQEDGMTNVKEHFVSIEVAKDWFDVAVLGEKSMMQFTNTKQGRAELVQWVLAEMRRGGTRFGATDFLPPVSLLSKLFDQFVS